jgi:sugar O-acyltransferase (sialic acid O-acetyltransferase NeuD family)
MNRICYCTPVIGEFEGPEKAGNKRSTPRAKLVAFAKCIQGEVGMAEVIIIGAGERGRVAAYYCEKLGFKVLGFLDDDKPSNEDVNGVPVLGEFDLLQTENFAGKALFHVAIGDPAARTEISRRVVTLGHDLASVIHPMTDIATTSAVGKGIFVAPFSAVGVNCEIADYVSIGMHVGIAADVRIGTGASVSGGSILNRAVRIGEKTFVGSSTTIVPEISVGNGCVIGAGSLVLDDIPDNCIAYGSPCRVVKQNLP